MRKDFYTLDDFSLEGKTVLLRVDINSPIDPSTGRILDDARIKMHISTIKDLDRSKVIILAHQSRPGKKDFTTLKKHAKRLSYLLGKKVKYVDGLFNSNVRDVIKNMKNGDVVLLENTRFYSEEIALKDKDISTQVKSHIVKRLAPLADFFVNDAFAAAHRSQPSIVGFAEVLPTLAGRVMERELNAMDKILSEKEKPGIAILGGMKADDSIDAISNLLGKKILDKVLTTGVVANIFILAQGHELGIPNIKFLEREVEDYIELSERAKDLLGKYKNRIAVPTDVVLNYGGKRRGIPVSSLPADKPIVDIGLDTVVRYINEIKKAKVIVLNGPAGVSEIEEFAFGTIQLFNAIARSDSFSVMGGGHTIAIAKKLHLEGKIDHISTGGGALINFLIGKKMPAIEMLKRSKRS